jgi:hypothetical protein
MTSGVRQVTFHPVEHTAEVSDYGQLDLAYQAGGVGSSDPSATLGSPSACCRAPTNVWPLSSAGLRSKPSRQNSIRCIQVVTRRPDGHETVHRLRAKYAEAATAGVVESGVPTTEVVEVVQWAEWRPPAGRRPRWAYAAQSNSVGAQRIDGRDVAFWRPLSARPARRRPLIPSL